MDLLQYPLKSAKQVARSYLKFFRNSTPISNKDLNNILKNWNIEDFKDKKIPMGASTHNWVLESPDGKFILRNAGSYRQHIELQILVLNKLVDCDFPYSIPKPQENRGSYYIKYRGNFWILYRFIEGSIVDSLFDNISDSAKQLGVMVGKYHKITNTINYSHINYNPEINFDDRAIDSLRKSSDLMSQQKNRVQVEDLFLEKVNNIIQACSSIPSDNIATIISLPRIPVHCDFNEENILVSNGKIVGLIDFDALSIKPKIFDFQNALIHAAGTPNGLSWCRMKDFVKGYYSVLPLSNPELDVAYSLTVNQWTWTLAWMLEKRRSKNSRVSDLYLAHVINVVNSIVIHKDEFINQLFATANAS